jgi:hypothetical protein
MRATLRPALDSKVVRGTALLVLAVASVSTAVPAASAPVSGLRGVVMRGPIAPVCRQGSPCEEPAKNFLLQFRRSGVVKASARTNDHGLYRVHLRPGRYAVTTGKLGPGRELTPTFVRVPRARIGHVDFHVDTGLG